MRVSGQTAFGVTGGT